jgi:hypothetical protein
MHLIPFDAGTGGWAAERGPIAPATEGFKRECASAPPRLSSSAVTAGPRWKVCLLVALHRGLENIGAKVFIRKPIMDSIFPLKFPSSCER